MRFLLGDGAVAAGTALKEGARHLFILVLQWVTNSGDESPRGEVMDPLTLGSITLLIICLLFMAVLKLINANQKSDCNQSEIESEGNCQSEVMHHQSLPWFNPEPRKDAIFAAGRYHWKMEIVYYSNDGSVKSATCAAPRTTGIPRHKVLSHGHMSGGPSGIRDSDD